MPDELDYARNKFSARPAATRPLSTRSLKVLGYLPLVEFALATLLLQSLTCPSIQAGQDKQSVSRDRLCYAFMRDGNLLIECDGKKEKISFIGHALDFAMSPDGTHFALQTKDDSGSSSYFLTVGTLGKEPHAQTKHIESRGLLWATCGSLLSFDLLTLQAVDLVTSQPVLHPPFKFFHCSSDLKVTAGWTEDDEKEQSDRKKLGDFFSGIDIRLTINRPVSQSHIMMWGPLEFDLSPNGKHLAFFGGWTKPKDPPKVCIQDTNENPSCVYDQGGHASVSDSGAVLYTTESGIKYWRPGLKKPLVMEGSGAEFPQWISPEVPAKLHEWNLKTTKVPNQP